MSGIPKTRTAAAKAICLIVILLLSMQYFINMVVYNRNHSTVLTVISYAVETGNRSAVDFLRNFMVQTTVKPMDLCPLIPADIKGRLTVNIQIPAWAYVEEQNQMLSPGGRYKPKECVARHKVAIIIPYRDREIHLKIFLQNIHPFLQSQQLDYGIFVVELAPGVRFNRAALFNIGFLEASKLYDFQCFIFHDVDLLPEDDRNLYICPSMPRHMSAAIDKLKYKLPYPQIFGGVSAISKDHFEKINGFSNLYFGWGGEDDDMYKRILYSNLTVIRYSTEVARYKMMSHTKDKGNPQRFNMLKSTRARRLIDGINSIKYTRLKLEFRPLYTWIYVTLNETETLNNKIVKGKIEAVQAMLAKMARDKAKADQQKNKTQGPVPKPSQQATALNGKSNQVAPIGKEVMTQVHRAQIRGLMEAKQAEATRSNESNVVPVKSPTAKAKPKQNIVSAKAKPIQKNGFVFAKPQFVSWIPTNASVPERLAIKENLGQGPIHRNKPK